MKDNFFDNKEGLGGETALSINVREVARAENGSRDLAQMSKRGSRKRVAKGRQDLEASNPSEGLGNYNLYRVVIAAEASESLDALVSKINLGFDGGKVSRPQLLSWLLPYFLKNVGPTEIQEIRAAHFDRIAYLESLLKKAKESGSIPTELEALMPGGYKNDATSKKTRRNLA